MPHLVSGAAAMNLPWLTPLNKRRGQVNRRLTRKQHGFCDLAVVDFALLNVAIDTQQVAGLTSSLSGRCGAAPND
jgi:hypothetical protein